MKRRTPDEDEDALFQQAMARAQAAPDDEALFLTALDEGAPPARPPAVGSPSSPAAAGDAEFDRELELFERALASESPPVGDRDAPVEQPTRTAESVTMRAVLRALRDGASGVDVTVDLHGMKQQEALTRVERALQTAHRDGHRTMLVITGKGYGSAERAVLREVVPEWMRTRFGHLVAEVSRAPKRLGGEGAVVVLLRRGGR
jgi:DNA-nicking Smr family endonuclease